MAECHFSTSRFHIIVSYRPSMLVLVSRDNGRLQTGEGEGCVYTKSMRFLQQRQSIPTQQNCQLWQPRGGMVSAERCFTSHRTIRDSSTLSAVPWRTKNEQQSDAGVFLHVCLDDEVKRIFRHFSAVKFWPRNTAAHAILIHF